MVRGALGVRQRKDTAASKRRCAAQNDSTRSSRNPNFAAADGAAIATRSPVLALIVDIMGTDGSEGGIATALNGQALA